MRSSSIFAVFGICLGSAVSQITTGEKGNATVITNNPIGMEVTGTLPAEPFTAASSLDGNVKGSITVKSGPGGIGVDYVIKFFNLPKEGGPFPYHIHEKMVPGDGNCTATAAHLDPTVRGEDPVCDKEFPQTCQVGDLSGKYGKIDSDPFEVKYHDEFGSMLAGSDASIPDRSFVVHFANKTRITCANFMQAGAPSNSTPTVTPTGGATPTMPGSTTSATVPVTAAANALNAERLAKHFGAAPLAAILYFFL